MDGVGFARFTSQGRVHVASYAVGLAYDKRGYGFYTEGNCMCHSGSELPPDWLGGAHMQSVLPSNTVSNTEAPAHREHSWHH
jgi:hypothetical protein